MNEPYEQRSSLDTLAIAFALACPTVVTVVYFVMLDGHPSVIQQAAFGIGKVIQFGFPAAWVVLAQHRRPVWHLPRRIDTVLGCGLGSAAFVLTLVLYHFWLKPAGSLEPALSAVHAKVAGIGVGTLPRYAALGAFYAVGHSLLEEYYWRWFVFGQLRRRTSLAVAVVISSVGFMAHHVVILSHFLGWFSIFSLLFSLAVAVGGAIWAWLYQRTGSLYGPWFSHLFVDAAIFIVGYDLAFAT